MDSGKIATPGDSFRARAERRQREYRAQQLKVPPGKWGHWLGPDAAARGANFVLDRCFDAAEQRKAKGKGVAGRTFVNMLASQTMCFNLFAPLAEDARLATDVLGPLLGLRSIDKITIEYTHEKDVFGDQTGIGGVDCDVLITGTQADGMKIVLAVETKFVETEFSICGFRKPGRMAKGLPVCPSDVAVAADESNCLYVSRKKYRYWQRTREHSLLRDGALSSRG